MTDNCAELRQKVATLTLQVAELEDEVDNARGAVKPGLLGTLNLKKNQLRQVKASLVECERPASTGILTVVSPPAQSRPELDITGSNFTPNSTFHLTISNVPGKTGDLVRDHSFDAKGAFQIFESFEKVFVSVDASLPKIIVLIIDNATGGFAERETSPEPFVIRF
jgi:hypothetical protein